MATLSITIDDTQVARVRAAYGAGSNAALKTAIIADIVAKVRGHEVNTVLTTERAKVTAAEAAASTAALAAEQAVNSEIIPT